MKNEVYAVAIKKYFLSTFIGKGPAKRLTEGHHTDKTSNDKKEVGNLGKDN